MKVLVTGSEGFVGPHLIHHLRDNGDEVVPTTRHGEGGTQPLDVTDADRCQEVLTNVGPEAVVHLAAVSQVGKDPGTVYRVNTLGSANILQACCELPDPPQVLLLSTGYVYGEVPASEQPIPETRPPRPTNHYAASKAAMEEIAMAYRAVGVPVAVVRGFNQTGPGQSPDFVAPTIVRQVAAIAAGDATGPLLLGNVHPVRDFTDVRDAVRAYRLLLEEAPLDGPVNVCSGEGISIGELAERALEVAGVDAEVVSEVERQRDRDVSTLVGDPGRVRDLTGWRPEVPLERTLQDLLAEHGPSKGGT